MRVMVAADTTTTHLTKEQENFLKQVAAPALESQRVFGIPACVIIAQSILESSARDKYGNWHWGGSSLFRNANNPFGIKNRDLPNDYGEYIVPTNEYGRGDTKPHVEVAAFEKFRSLHDAFSCHAALIANSKTYKPAMAAASDWRKFAEALGPKKTSSDAAHCGYATDPNYGAKLAGLVQRYRLDDAAVLMAYADAAPVVPQAPARAVEGVDV
jgi:flagellum-specific peptidoglycan hydrolase FlgJ